MSPPARRCRKPCCARTCAGPSRRGLREAVRRQELMRWVSSLYPRREGGLSRRRPWRRSHGRRGICAGSSTRRRRKAVALGHLQPENRTATRVSPTAGRTSRSSRASPVRRLPGARRASARGPHGFRHLFRGEYRSAWSSTGRRLPLAGRWRRFPHVPLTPSVQPARTVMRYTVRNTGPTARRRANGWLEKPSACTPERNSPGADNRASRRRNSCCWTAPSAAKRLSQTAPKPRGRCVRRFPESTYEVGPVDGHRLRRGPSSSRIPSYQATLGSKAAGGQLARLGPGRYR